MGAGGWDAVPGGGGFVGSSGFQPGEGDEHEKRPGGDARGAGGEKSAGSAGVAGLPAVGEGVCGLWQTLYRFITCLRVSP